MNKYFVRAVFFLFFGYAFFHWYYYPMLTSEIANNELPPPSYFQLTNPQIQQPSHKAKIQEIPEQPFNATLINCINAETELKKREHKQANALRDFVNTTDTGISHEKIAMLAGIPLETYRKYTMPHRYSIYQKNFLSARSEQIAIEADVLARSSKIASIPESKKIINAIDEKDLAFLNEILKEEPKKQLQISGVDLLTVVFVRHPHLTTSELQVFLNIGIKPTLLSLTKLYHRENRVELLHTLLPYISYIPLDTYWMNGFYYENLLLDALKNNDFQIANFWYEHGTPPLINSSQPNALDVFPIPKKNQTAIADELLIKFLNDLTRPYDGSNIEKINKIINQSSTLDVETYQISELDIDPIITTQAQNLIKKLEIAAKSEKTISQQDYQQCLKLEEFQEYRIENTPSIDRGVTSENILKNIDSIPEIALPFIDLFAGDRNAAEKLKDTFGISSNSIVIDQTSLMRAIQDNRPKNEVIAIADKLTSIPDPLINALAANARWDLLDYFINRGVDINSTDKDGHGPLFYALGSRQPYRTFGYLAQRGAKPQAPDALIQRAIEVTLRDKKHLTIMQWTAAHMQITQAHLTYFYETARADQPNYAEVLNILEQKLQP